MIFTTEALAFYSMLFSAISCCFNAVILIMILRLYNNNAMKLPTALLKMLILISIISIAGLVDQGSGQDLPPDIPPSSPSDDIIDVIDDNKPVALPEIGRTGEVLDQFIDRNILGEEVAVQEKNLLFLWCNYTNGSWCHNGSEII